MPGIAAAALQMVKQHRAQEAATEEAAAVAADAPAAATAAASRHSAADKAALVPWPPAHAEAEAAGGVQMVAPQQHRAQDAAALA